MPHEYPSSDSVRNENTRSESVRSERPGNERLGNERFSAANAMNSPLGEWGARGVSTSLRLQQEMFDVFQDIGREWFARATSEAELVFKLPNKLSAARSVSDALSTYHEWLGECINMLGEDGRRFVSDGQKIIDTGVRCISKTAPPATS